MGGGRWWCDAFGGGHYLRSEKGETDRVQRSEVARSCACAAYAAHLIKKLHKHATHRARACLLRGGYAQLSAIQLRRRPTHITHYAVWSTGSTLLERIKTLVLLVTYDHKLKATNMGIEVRRGTPTGYRPRNRRNATPCRHERVI